MKWGTGCREKVSVWETKLDGRLLTGKILRLGHSTLKPMPSVAWKRYTPEAEPLRLCEVGVTGNEE